MKYYAEYGCTLEDSPDSCGEATPEQVAEVLARITAHLEAKFPGLKVTTGIDTHVYGPDEDVCDEIFRAGNDEFIRIIASIQPDTTMNPLIPKLETEIQAADAAARKLLTEALASGGHQTRAELAHRASLLFTEAATLGRLRSEMLAGDTTSDKVPSVYTIGGGSGRLHVLKVGFEYQVVSFRRDKDGAIDWSDFDVLETFPDEIHAAEYLAKLRTPL